MSHSLGPTCVRAAVLGIPFRDFYEQGVRVFAFDLDNTLIAPGETEPASEILLMLREIALWEETTIVFASNNPKDRSGIVPFPVVSVRPRSRWHWLICRKPQRRYFRMVLDATREDPENILMIGDKYGRDIVGARRVGMLAALVLPIGPDLLPDRLSGLRWRERRLLLTRYGIDLLDLDGS